MSWYSIIYVFVRQYRKRHPITGFFLYLSLNTLLIVQLAGSAFSYYVYTFMVCGKMSHSTVQICVYLAVYNTLFLMFGWSLFQTLRTPVTRVPEIFRADTTFDQQIKEVTPCTSGRYFPDQSNEEQVQQQHKLLNELVRLKGIKFVETDYWQRYRYCYQCALLKPDRSHHCSSCGLCVVKFDHHCPWINKCVSHKNYKFFLLYLLYGCAIIFWSLLTSVEAFVRYFVKQNWMDELDAIILISMCMIMHGVFGYYPLGELLIYHLRLISTNETTCEQAKTPIIRGDEGRADYNLGCYYNFRSVFGWGLWLFPVDTSITDGMHFAVRYTDTCSPVDKLVVRALSETNCTLGTTPDTGR